MTQDGKLEYTNAKFEINPNQLHKFMLGCSNIVPCVTDSNLVYIDLKGNPAFQSDAYAKAFIFSERLARVEVNEKYGFIDTLGKLVIPAIYSQASDFNGGRALVSYFGESYYIDHHGATISRNMKGFCWGNEFWRIYANGEKFAKETKYAIESVEDKKLSEYLYEGWCDGIIGNLVCLKKEGKWGYFNIKNFNEEIPFIYEEARPFSEGLACVIAGKKCGYINEKGETVIPIIYDIRPSEGVDSSSSFVNGFVRLVKGTGEKNADGKEILKWAYADKLGNFITEFLYDGACDFREGIAAVCRDGKWGLINKLGKEIVAPIYDEIYYNYYDNYGDILACVKNDGKWGVIDKGGSIIIPFSYDEIKNHYTIQNDPIKKYQYRFNEECFSVKLNGKWGIIDKSGKIIVPMEYDNDIIFINGYAIVRRGGEYGVMDSKGSIVIPCTHDLIRDISYLKYTIYRNFPPKMLWIMCDGRQIFRISNANSEPYWADSYGNRYLVPFSLSQYADYYINMKMNGSRKEDQGWMQKGEFEKTADYYKRMTPQSIALKRAQYAEEAMNIYLGIITLGAKLSFSLGEYDADSECFNMKEDSFGEFKLSVPINEAHDFKATWNDAKQSESKLKFEVIPKYTINGDHVDLSSVTFTIVPNGKSYIYLKK